MELLLYYLFFEWLSQSYSPPILRKLLQKLFCRWSKVHKNLTLHSCVGLLIFLCRAIKPHSSSMEYKCFRRSNHPGKPGSFSSVI